MENFYLKFEPDLQNILDKYNDTDEPMDGDAVDLLVEHIHNALDLMQGNITESEYISKMP